MSNIYDLSFNSYGAGTVDTPKRFSIFDRLLAPEEWENLGPGEKLVFDNYMDYVNQFKQVQKSKRREWTPGTRRVPQGGSFVGSGGGTKVSTRGAGATASRLPRAKTHIGLSGGVSFEPTGGRRTLSGEYIPKSLEDIEQSLQLQTAIPGMEAESLEGLLTKQRKALEARRGMKAEQYLAGKTPKELYGTTKEGQAAQRIEQAGQRIEIGKSALDLKWAQYDKLPAQEKLEAIRNENRAANIKLRESLKTARDEWKADYDMQKLEKLGKIPGTEAAKRAQLEELEFYKRKAQVRLDNAKTLAEEKFHRDVIDRLEDQKFWYDKEMARTLPFGAERDVEKLTAGREAIQTKLQPEQFKNADELVAAYQAGRIDRETAERIAKEREW